MMDDLFALQDILKAITFREGYLFDCFAQHNLLWMQLVVHRTGSEAGQTMPPMIVHTPLNPDIIIRQALKTVLDYEDREAREAFKYKGQAIFGSDVSVDNLVLTLSPAPMEDTSKAEELPTPEVVAEEEIFDHGKSGAW